MSRLLFLVAIVSCFVISNRGLAQSLNVDFATDILASDYTGNINGPGGNYNWSSSGGVGFGGGVQAPPNGDVMTNGTTTFDFSIVGTTVSASLDFLYDDLFTSGGANQVGRVGFTPNLGDPFNSGFTFYAGVGNNPDAGNILSWNLNGTTSNGSDGNTDFDAVMFGNQWYRVSIDGVVSDVDELQYNVELFSIGASGTSAPTLLDDIMVTNTADLSGDTTWHAGFKTRGDKGGIAIDNHVADVSQPSTFASLRVNRDSGEIVFNNTAAAIDFTGYTIASDGEALDPSQWTSIADNYDADSGGSVDADDTWSVTASTFADLSEGTGGFATLATNQSISLGDAWTRGPLEDLSASLVLSDGSTLGLPIIYEGNGGSSFGLADLDLDGDLDANDWSIFKGGQGADFSGVARAAAYLQGDLDRDGDNDVRDFIAFKNAFDTANGAGAFAAMVPEPNSVALVAIGMLCLLGFRRRR